MNSNQFKADKIQPNVEVCRVLKPVDSNPHGTAHGGTILSLIEEAGYIASLKFCRLSGLQYEQTLLCRIEKTDFIKPAHIGDLVIANANVDFATQSRIRVSVTIHSAKISITPKVVNRAVLWYICVNIDTKQRAIPITLSKVPDYFCIQDEQDLSNQEKIVEQYRKEHETILNTLEKEDLFVPPTGYSYDEVGQFSAYFKGRQSQSNDEVAEKTVAEKSVADSITSNYFYANPANCTPEGVLTGGALLKRMDELGAIAAAKHALSPVVTACIETVNFFHSAKNGQVVFIQSVVCFTSDKSIDVLVRSWVLGNSEEMYKKLCSAHFVFVALSPEGRPRSVPRLRINSNEEHKLFEQASMRYKNRKNK